MAFMEGIFLAVLLVPLAAAGRKFDVNQQEDGFSVTVKGLKILEHSVADPCLYLGAGNSTFTSIHGNFHIEHSVRLREGTGRFHIQQHADDEAGGKEEEEEEEDVRITLYVGSGSSRSVVLRLSSSARHDLELRVEAFPGDVYDRSWLRLMADADESVFGGGEQYTYFNLRGNMFDIWTREQGVGRDKGSLLTFLADTHMGGAGGNYDWTYFPQASFHSSRHYYCHIDGSNFARLDFGSPTHHELFVLGTPSAFFFGKEDNMEQLVSRFVRIMGHTPHLPEWIREGTILGLQGGMDRVLSIVNKALDAGVSVNGVWIQDWPGHIFTSFGKRVFWNWQWNQTHYPDLDRHIAALGQRGVNFLAYITPHINKDGGLYADAAERDLFMKRANGSVYLIDFGEYDVGTVDLTKPEAMEWMKGVIKENLIELGFKGWMADFSEYIPVDAVFHNGETGLTMHNRFPVLWAKANREAVEEAGKLGEIFYYMRAGGAGSAEYQVATWVGDQNVDWSYTDGLATVVPAALSLGMSGAPITHFDIGGYTTIVRQLGAVNVSMVRTKELFFRYAELAVFTPIMRTHEGNKPLANFQVYEDAAALQEFAVLVDMYRALAPYTRVCLEQITSQGLPIQRPLFVHYEQDPRSAKIQYEYLYGRDLLVAPVLDPGVASKESYLPGPEIWVHLFSGRRYDGGQTVTVEAPLGYPPVFYRSTSDFGELFKKVADLRMSKGDLRGNQGPDPYVFIDV